MPQREIGGIFPLEIASINSMGRRRDQTIFPGGMLCLSGRTALRIVIEDALDSRLRHPGRLPTAYLPSYCCDSMIEPFVAAGFEVKFYKVGLDAEGRLSYEIDLSEQCDLFMATSYFGYASTIMSEWISAFNRLGVVTVEDVTHRLLAKPNPKATSADYTFASVRKWVGAPMGGVAGKRGRSLVRRLRPAGSIAKVATRAMGLKGRYLEGSGSPDVRDEYLALQRLQSEMLAEDYNDRALDDLSHAIITTADFDEIRARRLQNARTLFEGVRSRVHTLSLPVELDESRDAPLFVPVLAQAGERDHIATLLRKNSLFMPIHWPKPPEVGDDPEVTEFYERQISLVCDQRYGPHDMGHIVAQLEAIAC